MTQDKMTKAAKILLVSSLLFGCGSMYATGEWDHDKINERYDAMVRKCYSSEFLAYTHETLEDCIETRNRNRATEHYRAEHPSERNGGGGGLYGNGFTGVYILR